MEHYPKLITQVVNFHAVETGVRNRDSTPRRVDTQRPALLRGVLRDGTRDFFYFYPRLLGFLEVVYHDFAQVGISKISDREKNYVPLGVYRARILA